MHNVGNRLLFLGAFLVLMAGCASKKSTPSHQLLPMPQMAVGDSTNVGQVSWREMFQDAELKALIEEALQNNLDLQTSAAGVRQARAGVRFAKGLDKPFVEGNASAGVRRYGFYTEAGAGNYDANFSPNLNSDQFMARDLRDFYGAFHARWEIDIWGKLRSKRKAALSRYLASEEALVWMETQVVTAVATAYIDLVAHKNELEVLDSATEVQQTALRFAQERKKAGMANELAVNQLEAQMRHYQGLQQEKLQLIREIENQLNLLLGRYPKEIAAQSNFLDQQLLVIPAVASQDLLERRPDIRAAALDYAATGADLHAARMELYPSLNLGGLFGLNSFNPAFFLVPESMTYQLLGGLMGPIINRSAQKSNIDFAKASQKQAFVAYQQAVMQGFYEALTQTQRIDNLNEVLKIKAQEVAAATNGAQNALLLFRSGKVSFVEVFIAQRELLTSQMEEIQLKREALAARVHLYKALGGG